MQKVFDGMVQKQAGQSSRLK